MSEESSINEMLNHQLAGAAKRILELERELAQACDEERRLRAAQLIADGNVQRALNQRGERIAELEREKDLAIKEANRRDQKWQQGLNEECGVELNYGLPHIDEKRPTFGEFIHELRQRVTELEHKNTELRETNLNNVLNKDYELEQLRKENAELKAYLRLYDQSDQLTTEPELRKSLIETGKERDQLRLQVVRFKNCALDLRNHYCATGEADCACPACTIAEQALSETPAQAAKEVLGPTVELLRMACDDGEGNLARAKKLGEDISKFHPTVPLYRKEITRLEALTK